MRNFTFVIIDDDHKNGLKTRAIAESIQNFRFLAFADNYDDGLDKVLEHNPDFIFLEIDPLDKGSNLSLHLINEMHRYLTKVPKVFVTTKNEALCLNAFKFGVFDYFVFPLETKELRKSLFRLEKELGDSVITATQVVHLPQNKPIQEQNQAIEPVAVSKENFSDAVVFESEVEELEIEEASSEIAFEQSDISDSNEASEENNAKEVTFLQTDNTSDKPLIICVKSYGDYRYIEAKDICYLQADNNSTDIHLNTGEMITAFKTLKHFEGVLQYPFVRIHNSYIVNIDFVSRIHTGNAVCHIKNSTTKLPFSKSYKENIDNIIATIAAGNYLEI